VHYLGDPASVGGVASIDSLKIFDGVYSDVRAKTFAAP